MIEDNLDEASEDSADLVQYPATYAVRRTVGRQKHVAILASPYKDDIDKLLFKEKMSAKQVHKWLAEEMHDDSVSYVALTRYRNDAETASIPSVIIETAEEEMRISWRVTSSIIRKGLELLENDATLVQLKDVLAAMKFQQELMQKSGMAVSFEQTEKAKAMLNRLVTEIIMPRINEEQRADILQAILDDDELASWVLPEEDD